ncbi:MAG: nucleotidyltransferase domain-containing protein [Proteobacteria bacterium]|nr:nucleotidyltransferase domain-containing protein [Pseudomonadota bacterium]
MTTAPALFDTAESRDALRAVCRRFHVRRLDVFGSAATGKGFDPNRSDLDVLVEFETLPSGEYADAYFGLQEALEALSARPVDLITPAALENPYFRQRVEAERRTLFIAT